MLYIFAYTLSKPVLNMGIMKIKNFAISRNIINLFIFIVLPDVTGSRDNLFLFPLPGHSLRL